MDIYTFEKSLKKLKTVIKNCTCKERKKKLIEQLEKMEETIKKEQKIILKSNCIAE